MKLLANYYDQKYYLERLARIKALIFLEVLQSIRMLYTCKS